MGSGYCLLHPGGWGEAVPVDNCRTLAPELQGHEGVEVGVARNLPGFATKARTSGKESRGFS